MKDLMVQCRVTSLLEYVRVMLEVRVAEYVPSDLD